MYNRKLMKKDLMELAMYRLKYKFTKDDKEAVEVLSNQVALKRSLLANRMQVFNMLGEEGDDDGELLGEVIKKCYRFSLETGLGVIDYIGNTAMVAPA